MTQNRRMPKFFRWIKLLCLSSLASQTNIVTARLIPNQTHFVQLVTSKRPWRTHKPNSRYEAPRRDYSAHYIDYEVVVKEPRARRWNVDFASRNFETTSWISKLVFMNIAAYALQVWRPSFTAWGVKRSDMILQGRQLYRLLTPVFLHGGIGHLLTNMYSLKNVGPELEKVFGSGRFISTYLLAGVAGNVLSAFQSPNPALGASGAVFGVLGAYTVFLNRHEWLLGTYGSAMSDRLVQTAFMNIALGFINPSVDNWGHIGGFLGGALMAYYVGPRLYLTDSPTGYRFLVDRPIVRLPRKIESIPDQVGDFAGKIAERLQLNRYLEGSPTRPWQRQRHSTKDFPSKSVKPKF